MRPVSLCRPRLLVRLVTPVVVGLAAALLSVVPAGIASAATTFTSTLVNNENSNCATVPNGAPTSALQLVQQACNSGTAQSFTFTPLSGTSDTYTVGTLTSGSCLDISGGSTADNAAVIQYACHSGTNQQFRLMAAGTNFQVQAVSSGKCVAGSGN